MSKFDSAVDAEIVLCAAEIILCAAAAPSPLFTAGDAAGTVESLTEIARNLKKHGYGRTAATKQGALAVGEDWRAWCTKREEELKAEVKAWADVNSDAWVARKWGEAEWYAHCASSTATVLDIERGLR